jgi:hypothetical protein
MPHACPFILRTSGTLRSYFWDFLIHVDEQRPRTMPQLTQLALHRRPCQHRRQCARHQVHQRWLRRSAQNPDAQCENKPHKVSCGQSACSLTTGCATKMHRCHASADTTDILNCITEQHLNQHATKKGKPQWAWTSSCADKWCIGNLLQLMPCSCPSASPSKIAPAGQWLHADCQASWLA